MAAEHRRSANGAHFAGGKPHKVHGVGSGSKRHQAHDQVIPVVPAGSPDIESFTEHAPQPIGVDPEATGAFSRLVAGEGAIATTRENADDAAEAARKSLSGTTGMMRLDAKDLPEVQDHREPKHHMSGKAMAVVALLVIVVVAGGLYLFSRVSAPAPKDTSSKVTVEQLQTTVDQTISYNGNSYNLHKKDDGSFELVGKEDGDNTSNEVLGDLKGVPVSFILFKGAIIAPENLPNGGWDVPVYTIGSGWSALAGKDGKACAGTGMLQEVLLDGSTLTLTDSNGSTSAALE